MDLEEELRKDSVSSVHRLQRLVLASTGKLCRVVMSLVDGDRVERRRV